MLEVMYDVSVVMLGIWLYKRLSMWYKDWKHHRWHRRFYSDDDPWNNY